MSDPIRPAEAEEPTLASVVLGIETSCDETAASVVIGGREVRSSVVSSQVDLHARYGGVVPEIASRAHLDLLVPVVAEAMVEAGVEGPDIDAVAATYGPGLIGALLVGVSHAKALALVWDRPFVAVNHLEAHLYASFLEEPDLDMPVVVLLVSGGHTLLVHMEGAGRYHVLGQTLDDAAGEAFDKGARLLGLGYPGGPALERLARDGDPEAFAFPTARRVAGLDFSFAGLKTALLYRVRELGETETERRRADLAASYQRAIVQSLALRVERALAQTGAAQLAIGGGVAANGPLRDRLSQLGVPVDIPPRELCTDNAAMIASAARYVPARPFPEYLDVDVYAT
ncbi:MAG TPA: tRNA (adenosine(37)-N6)-threonylcarbamoyltransferase complex transferase subunit TsaD, partial [Acidimicrobiales bacterium]